MNTRAKVISKLLDIVELLIGEDPLDDDAWDYLQQAHGDLTAWAPMFTSDERLNLRVRYAGLHKIIADAAVVDPDDGDAGDDGDDGDDDVMPSLDSQDYEIYGDDEDG